MPPSHSRYDSGNTRTVKQSLSPDASAGTSTERIHLYVYPGDFERAGVRVDRTNAYAPVYVGDTVLGTETEYHVAGTSVVWKSGTPQAGLERQRRILLPLRDLLGTASAVVDLDSGRLVEMATFTPNGAREMHWTTDEASVRPERYAFTGKEEDEEVGVSYFGHRYLIARIGRWASPDPLSVHAMGGGEVANEFHYVAGNLLQAVDPIGLDAERPASGGCGVDSSCSVRYQVVTPPRRAEAWAQVHQTHADGSTAQWNVRTDIAKAVQAALDVLSKMGVEIGSAGGDRGPSVSCSGGSCRGRVLDAGDPDNPAAPISGHSLGTDFDTDITARSFGLDPQSAPFALTAEYVGERSARNVRLRVWARVSSASESGEFEILTAMRARAGGVVDFVGVVGRFVDVTAVFESFGITRTQSRSNWQSAIHSSLERLRRGAGARGIAPRSVHGAEAHHFQRRDTVVGRPFYEVAAEMWDLSAIADRLLWHDRNIVIQPVGTSGAPRVRR